MITLTAEFLDKNWGILQTGSVLPVSLLEWDDGDAYTQSSLAPYPGKIVFGALALQGTTVSDFSIVITFSKEADPARSTYTAPDGDHYRAAAEHRREGSVTKHEVAVPRLRSALGSRRDAFLESNLLANRFVTVVGLGTGGVQVALELARAGVGRFSLIDPDRLEVGNVSRHQAGVSFVGRRKVFAARDLLLESNPTAHIDPYPIRADASEEELLQRLFGESDLVICATDSRPSKLLVNSLCLSTRTTAIYGGAFRRAYGGQVLRVRPDETACYHCFVLAMPDTESDSEVSSEEDAALVAYSDRPVVVEPGLSLDVAPISIMTAKLALQELIRTEKSTLHVLDKDLDASWYLWINRPEPGTKYAAWPPLSESIDEMTILRWYGVYIDRDPACPACGDFRRALIEQYGIGAGSGEAPVYRPFPAERPEGSSTDR